MQGICEKKIKTDLPKSRLGSEGRNHRGREGEKENVQDET